MQYSALIPSIEGLQHNR